jgi:hypothetical protein
MPAAIVKSVRQVSNLKGTIVVKVFSVLAMLGIIAAATISGAQAQTSTTGNSIPDPIVVRLGVVWPNDSAVRNLSGDSPISAGVDYALGQSGLNGSNISSIFLDYYGGSANGHFNAYGLGLSDRVYTSSSGPVNQSTGQAFFTGGGAGVYQLDDSFGDATTFGVKIFGCIEYSQRYIVQLNYLFLPGAAGVNGSGFGLQVGMRF